MWVAQRGSGSPSPGSIPSQVGWDSDQPALFEDVPVDCSRIELDDLYRSLSTKTSLRVWFWGGLEVWYSLMSGSGL